MGSTQISIFSSGNGTELMEVTTRHGSFRASREDIHDPWLIGYFHIRRACRGKGHGRKLAEFLPVYCYLEVCAWDLSHGALSQSDLTRFYFSLGFRRWRRYPESSNYMIRDLRKSGWPRKPRKNRL